MSDSTDYDIPLDEKISNLRKWIAALRSGNYNQTTNTLKDECGYCCLGVAAEAVFNQKFEKYNSHSSQSYYAYKDIEHDAPYISTYDNQKYFSTYDNTLSEYHTQALGLDVLVPQFGSEDFAKNPDHCKEIAHEIMIALNDTYDYDFEKIADYIEKYILQPLLDSKEKTIVH